MFQVIPVCSSLFQPSAINVIHATQTGLMPGLDRSCALGEVCGQASDVSRDGPFRQVSYILS